jgi:hypothetical protein
MNNKQEKCVWTEDEDGIWNTSCGNAFIMNDETPSENDFKFCCFCGKLLVEEKYHD